MSALENIMDGTEEEYRVTPKGFLGEKQFTALMGRAYVEALARKKQPDGTVPAIVFNGHGGEWAWVTAETEEDAQQKPPSP